MATVTGILIILAVGAAGYFLISFIVGYLEKPKSRKVALAIDILGVIFLILALGGFYLYFFILSPTFVEKPYMEKPFLNANASTKEEAINAEHIAYLVNEMGGYKLHEDPLSRTIPEFEFIIKDFDRIYAVRVIDNKVNAVLGSAINPDARISGKQETVILLFQSNNFKEDLVKFAKQGKFSVEILTDETTLALKGYKALYDKVKE